MILLSAPPIEKDASQASERIHPDQFQPLTESTLTELLDLPGLEVTGLFLEQSDEVSYLHIECIHQHALAICPRCQQPSERCYDRKKRSVRHVSLFGMRTVLHFKKRRFECEVCGVPFSELLSWIEPKRRQTLAYEMTIFEAVKKSSRKQVALEEGLSESTVFEIFKRQTKASLKTAKKQDIHYLGVDELSIRKGHKNYALVLSDIERRCVVAVFDNRRQETFGAWIDSLTPTQRRAIKVVSMDMWNPYRHIVKRKLPWAMIVADRFHVMKQLNHQLNLLRRKQQRKADQPLTEVLKGCRWILLKNRDNLTPDQEDKLRLILDSCPPIKEVYLLKEQFRTICDKINDRDQAERFLRVWLYNALNTGNRYLAKFVKTLRNWWTEFLNYFHEGVTQGFVEGTNRAIRGIINRAFGFRNFDNFRLQVLAQQGIP